MGTAADECISCEDATEIIDNAELEGTCSCDIGDEDYYEEGDDGAKTCNCNYFSISYFINNSLCQPGN